MNKEKLYPAKQTYIAGRGAGVLLFHNKNKRKVCIPLIFYVF